MVSWSVGRGGGVQRPLSRLVAGQLHWVGVERLGRLAELLPAKPRWARDGGQTHFDYEWLFGWLGAAIRHGNGQGDPGVG